MSNSDVVSRGKIARGAGWMIFLRWGVRSLGFVRTLILARLLIPADFGLVALAMMMLGFVEALTKLRPDFALIQNTRAERRHYDTVWTFMVLRGALIAVVLVMVAGPCARYFDAPPLEVIVYCLAFVIFVEGFQNVGAVDFFKDLTFDKVFRLNFVSRLGSVAIAVIVALIWQNYWALIAGFASARLLIVVFSYRMHPYRPRFSLEAWREIFHFSKWLLPHGIVFSLRQRADAFIIGKWLGPASLGFYDLAKTIAQFAGAELAAPLRSVMFPAYAQMAEDPGRLRNSFVAAFAVIFAIGAPVATLLGLLAEPFVRIALGQNWMEIIPLIQVLVIYTLAQLCNSSCGALFLALGKTFTMLLVQTAGAAVAVPAIFLGVEYAGTYGVAWAVVIASAVTTFLSIAFALKLANVCVRAIVRPLLRSVGALVAMVFVVRLASTSLFDCDGLICHSAELLLCGAGGTIVYASVHFLLWRLSGMPEGPEVVIPSAFGSILKVGKIS